MATKNVMDDGYTKSGYIARPDGFDADLHEGLEFTYRPMLVQETEELVHAMNRLVATGEPVKATLMEALNLAKRIVSWSEVDKDNRPREITLDAVRALPPTLYRRVRNIIVGVSGSDPRPNQPTNAPQTELEKELDLALKGKPPVEAVEGDLKNSAAG